MLEVLSRFLPALVVLPSIERIGLTGSIATPKKEPKDIEVVVCTKEGADLTQLATTYRKMSGRLQSTGRGTVDIFIFENGSYIGRPCPCRECAPGIRQSCTADHCGLRPYLRDDLSVVELYPTTLTRLPVQLHPDGWFLDDVPDDVKEFVRRNTRLKRSQSRGWPAGHSKRGEGDMSINNEASPRRLPIRLSSIAHNLPRLALRPDRPMA